MCSVSEEKQHCNPSDMIIADESSCHDNEELSTRIAQEEAGMLEGSLQVFLKYVGSLSSFYHFHEQWKLGLSYYCVSPHVSTSPLQQERCWDLTTQ